MSNRDEAHLRAGRPVLLLVCLLVLPHAGLARAWEPGKIAKDTFKSGDQAVAYFLYVPKGVSVETPAPLLLLLHGSGRDGRTMIDEWKKQADKERIVLAGPNAQDPRGWYLPADGPGLVCALLSDLQRTLPVNPRRTYLFGHSAGAVFGLYLAMLESHYFAAAAVHAGAWRTQEERQAAGWCERKIPVAIFVGERDAFFPVDAVKATEAALKEEQVPVQVEIIANHDHNYYALSGRINESAWGFLKPRELTAAPKFSEHTFSR